MIEVELPDGAVAEFPDGTDRTTIQTALQRRFQAEPAATPAQPAGVADTIGQLGRDAARGAGLAVRSVIEGAGAPVTALTDAAGRLALGDNYQPVSETLTAAGLPEPATAAERVVSAVGEGGGAALTGVGLGNALLRSGSSGARAAGSFLAENPLAQLVAGGSAGAGSQGAAEAGASPLVQLLAGTATGIAGGAAAIPRASATAPRVEPRLGEMGEQAAQAAAVQTAAQDAAQTIGLNWGAIDDGLRNQITANVARAMQASDLPPEAAARAALYESLGMTPTRGMATRRLADTRSEQILRQQPEGEAIRAIYDQNNAAVRQQIQSLRPEGVQGVDAPTFGQRFRAPIAAGERRHQQVANRFYRDAEAAEGGNLTSVQPLVDHLQQNLPMLEATDAAKPVIAYLRQSGVISPRNMQQIDPAGGQAAAQGFVAMDMNLKELAGLRRVVNQAWSGATKRGDDLAASQLNQMRGFIDEAEGAAGGELYNAYRRLRSRKGGLYEDNPLIDQLVSDRKGYRGTDLIEDSQVFDRAVLSSTTEQFSKVWPRLRADAKDLTRAQVAKYIEERAFSNMGTNERGDVVASPAKLHQAISSINPEKLRLIYGPEKARQLNSLNTALREISNPPAGSVPSGSAPMLDHLARGVFSLLRAVPLIGDTAVKQVGDAMAGRRNAQAVEQAINFLPQRAPVAQAAAPNPLLQLAAPAAYGATATSQ